MSDYLTFWKAGDGNEAVFFRPVETGALYVTPALAPLLDRLLLFSRQNQALVLITGEAGTGKSTLLKWLYDNVPPESHEMLLCSMVRRETEAGWLTPLVASLMGRGNDGEEPADLPELIRWAAGRMDELIAEKRKLIVAIDAAHLAATPAALDEVVAFLNLQSLAGTCLSFVLCGDQALSTTIEATPELAAKVALHVALPLLSRRGCEEYLMHRMAAAGLAVPFEAEALDLLAEHSRGVMTQLNGLAENALIEAAREQVRRISARMVGLALQNVAPTGDRMRSRRTAPQAPSASAPPSQASAVAPSVLDAESDESTPSASTATVTADAAKAGIPTGIPTPECLAESAVESGTQSGPTVTAPTPLPPSPPMRNQEHAKGEEEPTESPSIKLSSLFKSERPKTSKP